MEYYGTLRIYKVRLQSRWDLENAEKNWKLKEKQFGSSTEF